MQPYKTLLSLTVEQEIEVSNEKLQIHYHTVW